MGRNKLLVGSLAVLISLVGVTLMRVMSTVPQLGKAVETSPKEPDSASLSESVRSLKSRLREIRRPVEGLLRRLEGQRESVSGSKQLLPKNFQLLWHENAPREDRIFVMMVSFRSQTCRRAVNALFANAKKADTVFLGLVEVHQPEDEPCIDPQFALCNQSNFCPTDNIRVRRFPVSEWQGASHARAISSELFHNEGFFLLLSPLAIVLPNWDEVVKGLYSAARRSGGVSSPKLVLTGHHSGGILCGGKVTERDARRRIEFEARRMNLSSPLLVPFISHDFLFSESSLLAEVPPDPLLRFIDPWDDALLTAVRLFSNGYTIYNIGPPVSTEGTENVGSAAPSVTPRETLERIDALIGVAPAQKRFDPGRFGLGGLKTAMQYFLAAGIDVEKRTVKDWCAK